MSHIDEWTYIGEQGCASFNPYCIGRVKYFAIPLEPRVKTFLNKISSNHGNGFNHVIVVPQNKNMELVGQMIIFFTFFFNLICFYFELPS